MAGIFLVCMIMFLGIRIRAVLRNEQPRALCASNGSRIVDTQVGKHIVLAHNTQLPRSAQRDSAARRVNALRNGGSPERKR